MKRHILSVFSLVFFVSVFGQNRIGVFTDTPASMLSVKGEVSIGNAYSENFQAPLNGLLVEGQVGIGISNPGSHQLYVTGTTRLNTLNINGAYTFPSVDGTVGYVLKTNGSGVVSWQPEAGGGVASVSAVNGLTATGTNNVVVKLGGNLTENTTISRMLDWYHLRVDAGVALGSGAQLTGATNLSNRYSAALGDNARATGESTAIGIGNAGTTTFTTASGYGLALGQNITASGGGNYAPVIAIGAGFTNATPASIKIGMNSPIPSLMIREGSATAAGNVGIGTDNPQRLLHIAKDNNFGHINPGTPMVRFQNLNNVTCPGTLNVWDWRVGNCGQLGLITHSDNENPNFNILKANDLTVNSDGPVASLSTAAPVNSLVLSAAGYIGLGTAAPNFALHLHQTGTGFGQPGIQLTNNSTGSGVNDGVRLAAQGLDFWVDNRSNGELRFATNGFERVSIGSTGTIRFQGYGNGVIRSDGSGFLSTLNFAALYAGGGSDPTGNSALVQRTADGVIEARGYRSRAGMNGANSGNVFNINWSVGAAELWIDVTNVGTISLLSDRRLKEDVKPMQEPAVGRVMALRPVTFIYKDVPGTPFVGSSKVYEGFLADELQAVIPSSVRGEPGALNEEGKIQPQTLELAPVVAVLTRAIQEQQEELKELKARLLELEAQNNLLWQMNREEVNFEAQN